MLDQTMQYATSFQMVDCGSCGCGRPLQEHKSLRNNYQVTAIQKNKIDEQLLRGSILRALGLDSGPLVSPTDMTAVADDPGHGQPESNKQSVKHLNKQSASQCRQRDGERARLRHELRPETAKQEIAGLLQAQTRETNYYLDTRNRLFWPSSSRKSHLSRNLVKEWLPVAQLFPLNKPFDKRRTSRPRRRPEDRLRKRSRLSRHIRTTVEWICLASRRTLLASSRPTKRPLSCPVRNLGNQLIWRIGCRAIIGSLAAAPEMISL